MLCSAAATFTASINCRKELNTAKTRTLSSAGCVCGKPTAEPGRGNGKSSNPAIQSLSTPQHLNLCTFAEYLSLFCASNVQKFPPDLAREPDSQPGGRMSCFQTLEGFDGPAA